MRGTEANALVADGTTLRPGERWRNWGRSVDSTPQFVATPESPDDVQSLVRTARDRGLTVKPVGAGHSFTAIAETTGVRLDLSRLGGVFAVSGNDVTLGAGTHLHELASLLEPHGLALPNMGDIDKQTISGAISTGTHGTGGAFTGIAAQVVGATLVTGTGELLVVSETENAEMLPAVALGLGALGVLIDVTLRCVPRFVLSARESREPLTLVVDGFADRVAAADHFEFYWFPHTDVALTKTNTRLPADAERRPLGRVSRWIDDELLANGLYAGIVELGRLVPASIPPINRLATKLTGERSFADYSPAVFVTNRAVRFREMEYGIPLEAVPDALRQIRALIERKGWRISFPIEVRAAAADDLWLSTASGRATGYIAVHRYFRENPAEYFSEVEAIMRSFDGRPHWGKMHTRGAATLAPTYPRFADFVALREKLDPDRVFMNDYLERVLGAQECP